MFFWYFKLLKTNFITLVKRLSFIVINLNQTKIRPTFCPKKIKKLKHLSLAANGSL